MSVTITYLAALLRLGRLHFLTGGFLLCGLGALIALASGAPPFRLDSRGLGELTVALIVTVLTPLMGFALQAGRLTLLPLLVVVPLFALQFAMMLVLELPDLAGDTAVGKRTLVAQLVPAGAVRLHSTVLALAYLSLPCLVWAGLPPIVAAAALLSAPVALWQARRLSQGAWGDRSAWGSLSFWAIGLLVGTAVAEVFAFLWAFQSR